MAENTAVGIGLRAAQVLGIASTAFVAGKTFSASFSTVPALLLAPAPVLIKQWKQMFDSDKALAPTIVLFSGGIFGYLAYQSPSSTSAARLYTASTTLLALSIPYTYLALEPINRKLEVLASPSADPLAEHGPRKDETSHYLVDRWATVNLGRTVLTGAAALCGMWAATGAKVILFLVNQGE